MRFFFLMIRRRPRSTLFPYTTLCRSRRDRPEMPREELVRLIQTLEDEMHDAARDLRFEYAARLRDEVREDRKSTRLNSSHANISYAVFCLKKKHVSSCPSLTCYLSCL